MQGVSGPARPCGRRQDARGRPAGAGGDGEDLDRAVRPASAARMSARRGGAVDQHGAGRDEAAEAGVDPGGERGRLAVGGIAAGIGGVLRLSGVERRVGEDIIEGEGGGARRGGGGGPSRGQ